MEKTQKLFAQKAETRESACLGALDNTKIIKMSNFKCESEKSEIFSAGNCNFTLLLQNERLAQCLKIAIID